MRATSVSFLASVLVAIVAFNPVPFRGISTLGTLLPGIHAEISTPPGPAAEGDLCECSYSFNLWLSWLALVACACVD